MIKRQGSTTTINFTPLILLWILATGVMKLMGAGISWKFVLAPVIILIAFILIFWVLCAAGILIAYLSGYKIKVNGRPVQRKRRRKF